MGADNDKSDVKINPHENHRERMRQRYTDADGFEGFHPHEVLEMLLYNGIPRKDTNVIAHELLRRFGSIKNVLKTPIADLMEVSDMTRNAAINVHMLGNLVRFININETGQTSVLKNTVSAAEYIYATIGDKDEEHFMVLCLDKLSNLVRKEIVAVGTPDKVLFFMRRVLKICLNSNASQVVIAHNHPDTNPRPSGDDYAVTDACFQALGAAGVQLVDHIIVCKRRVEFFSFRSANYFDHYNIDPDVKRKSHVLGSNAIFNITIEHMRRTNERKPEKILDVCRFENIEGDEDFYINQD